MARTLFTRPRPLPHFPNKTRCVGFGAVQVPPVVRMPASLVMASATSGSFYHLASVAISPNLSAYDASRIPISLGMSSTVTPAISADVAQAQLLSLT